MLGSMHFVIFVNLEVVITVIFVMFLSCEDLLDP